jgi:excisionase family DNA binding protein
MILGELNQHKQGAIDMRKAETISCAEAGRRLGVGRMTAYRLAHAGVIPALRLGKKLRVPVAALEEMLRSPKPLNQQERDQRRRQRRAHVEALAANGWRGKSHGAAR